MKIIYNGILIEQDDLKISPLSSGFSYGEGFFTTIKVIDGLAQNMMFHLKRINISLEYFKFALTQPKWNEEINRLLEANIFTDARIKITLFRDVTSISYIIYCTNLVVDKNPVDLTISKYVRGDNPLYRYKSLNYYQNLKSAFEVYKDCDDNILETGFANIFIIKENAIYTPSDTLPILLGTYRSYLLSKDYLNYLPIYERVLTVTDLLDANEVFLTNSIRGILPVKSIDNTYFSTSRTEQIMDNLC